MWAEPSRGTGALSRDTESLLLLPTTCRDQGQPSANREECHTGPEWAAPRPWTSSLWASENCVSCPSCPAWFVTAPEQTKSPEQLQTEGPNMA